MGANQPTDQERAAASLVALARHGIPPDVQELLVYGDPGMGIRPGALAAAIAASRIIWGIRSPHTPTRKPDMPTPQEIKDRADRALQKLAKWRGLLAGWHLGTQATDAPGVRAMRDLRELVLILRAENSALVSLLAQKDVFTSLEFTEALGREAALLDGDMARHFPGFRTSAQGVVVHDPELAAETTARLGFPL